MSPQQWQLCKVVSISKSFKPECHYNVHCVENGMNLGVRRTLFCLFIKNLFRFVSERRIVKERLIKNHLYGEPENGTKISTE